jgi:Tfp pilus assembly protein FimT
MRSQRATSLVELLVVLGLMGLMAGGLWLLNPHTGLAREAELLARLLRDTRLTAVVSGVPQVVGGTACAGTVAHGLRASVTFPTRGLLFAPDGLPRACHGGGLGNTTIGLRSGQGEAAVVVSTLGRVRWEMR